MTAPISPQPIVGAVAQTNGHVMLDVSYRW